MEKEISIDERERERYNKLIKSKCAKLKSDIKKCYDNYIDSFLKK